MSNMSYCRFENTLADLRDCNEHMDEDMEDRSDEEKQAKKNLIKLCKEITSNYGDE